MYGSICPAYPCKPEGDGYLAYGMENQTSSIQTLWSVTIEYVNSLIEKLPALVLAIVVIGLFVLVGKVVKRVVRRVSKTFVEDPSLQSLFSTLAYIATFGFGIAIAGAILFPGLEAGDLVAVVGLSSVAVGFAFKDIFENFLAGIIILSRRPFHPDDQIHTESGLEGTVLEISFRNTHIRTYDGQRVVIPNSMLFKNPVTVRTSFDTRRSAFTILVGFDEDLERAAEVLYEAVSQIEGVLDEPEPQIYCVEYVKRGVEFDVRYWTDSRRSSVTSTRNLVGRRLKPALEEAGIHIPYPHRVVQFDEATQIP